MSEDEEYIPTKDEIEQVEENTTKRFASALELMQQPKRARESLAAAVSYATSGGASVKFLVESTRFYTNPDAPVQVTGFIGADVSVPHEKGKFESSFPDFVPRTPFFLKKGTYLTISCFIKDPSKRNILKNYYRTKDTKDTVSVNTPLRLFNIGGLSYCINLDTAGLQVDGIDEFTEAEGKIQIRQPGDLSLQFNGRDCTMVRSEDEEIYSVLASAYMGCVEKCPNYPILSYPDADRILIKYKPSKNKEETEQLVIHPNLISNEILYSRQYPRFAVVFHLRNLTYFDEKFNSDKYGGICQAVCTIPDDNVVDPQDSDIVFKRRTGELELCIRGKDKVNLTRVFTSDGLVGTCAVSYYSDEVNKLGIYDLDIAKNCMSTIMTYIDAICMVNFNHTNKHNDEILKTGNAFIIHGTAKFLKINYKETFAGAGLRVSVEFVQEVLTSFMTKKNFQGKGYVSEKSVSDLHWKHFRNHMTDPPEILCLNTFSGDMTKELSPEAWDFYAVPTSDLYGYQALFQDDGEDGKIQTIIKNQRFWEKGNLKENEEFIRKEWSSALKRVTFFAVRH